MSSLAWRARPVRAQDTIATTLAAPVFHAWQTWLLRFGTLSLLADGSLLFAYGSSLRAVYTAVSIPLVAGASLFGIGPRLRHLLARLDARAAPQSKCLIGSCACDAGMNPPSPSLRDHRACGPPENEKEYRRNEYGPGLGARAEALLLVGEHPVVQATYRYQWDPRHERHAGEGRRRGPRP